MCDVPKRKIEKKTSAPRKYRTADLGAGKRVRFTVTDGPRGRVVTGQIIKKRS